MILRDDEILTGFSGRSRRGNIGGARHQFLDFIANTATHGTRELISYYRIPKRCRVALLGGRVCKLLFSNKF